MILTASIQSSDSLRKLVETSSDDAISVFKQRSSCTPNYLAENRRRTLHAKIALKRRLSARTQVLHMNKQQERDDIHTYIHTYTCTYRLLIS